MHGLAQLFQSAAGLCADALGSLGLRRWLLSRPLPPRHEQLDGVGCRRPIQVAVDRWGVPHIRAEESADVFFGQGYCHARDRLWQMEVNRRMARGELAELFGARAVEIDRVFRRFGFRRAAEAEAAALEPDARAALDAYAAGVNAYIDRHAPPVEFVLLRTRPRAWTVVDSLAFARYMGWMLTANGETELIRARLVAALGPERAAALELRESSPTTAGLVANEAAPASPSLVQGEGGGSNNWVVAGSRSATGRPLLANDPHLKPRLPCTWYVAHLQGPSYDVIGGTLPGAVGVLVGHNAHVAWGVTASTIDGQDVFIEEADPAYPHRFRGVDGWYEAEIVREEIVVRGSTTPVVENVIRTCHGPLLNGVLGVAGDGPLLAFADATAGAASPMHALLEMNRATDWPTFRAALAKWTTPTLNFVYADTAGVIAYKMAGRVPIRAGGDGSVPVPGSGSCDWTGWVPFDELPEAVNPPEGLWATANSRPAAPCPHFLTRDWVDDGRQRRILELLRAKPTHTLADFGAMQGDLTSLPAQEAVRRLQACLDDPKAAPTNLTPVERDALARLSAWDGRLTTDSVSAALYHVFRHQLLLRLAADAPESVRGYILGQGVSEMLSSDSVFHIRGSSILLGRLDALLAQPEGRRHVGETWTAAVVWLRQHYGPDPKGWTWGRLHAVRFDHVLGRAAPWLDRLLHLSRGPTSIGGDQDTLAQSGVDPWRPFAAAAFTVSYRQLFDVGDWDAGLFVLPTGQSGHPGSPHYDDMLEAWSRTEYRPLLFTREAVAAATTETIELRPSPGDETEPK